MIAWLKVRVWKLEEFTTEMNKGGCKLCLGNKYVKLIDRSSFVRPETRKWGMGFV
jgi:hypothetical protein